MYLLIGIMFASGFAELLSLGAVLPFLAVLTNPSRIWDQQLVQWLATLLQFSKPSQLLLPITLAFSLSSVLSAATRLANLWLNGRFAAAVGSDLSCESYYRTLYQPYHIHLRRDSSNVITNVTSHI